MEVHVNHIRFQQLTEVESRWRRTKINERSSQTTDVQYPHWFLKDKEWYYATTGCMSSSLYDRESVKGVADLLMSDLLFTSHTSTGSCLLVLNTEDVNVAASACTPFLAMFTSTMSCFNNSQTTMTLSWLLAVKRAVSQSRLVTSAMLCFSSSQTISQWPHLLAAMTVHETH